MVQPRVPASLESQVKWHRALAQTRLLLLVNLFASSKQQTLGRVFVVVVEKYFIHATVTSSLFTFAILFWSAKIRINVSFVGYSLFFVAFPIPFDSTSTKLRVTSCDSICVTSTKSMHETQSRNDIKLVRLAWRWFRHQERKTVNTGKTVRKNCILSPIIPKKVKTRLSTQAEKVLHHWFMGWRNKFEDKSGM